VESDDSKDNAGQQGDSCALRLRVAVSRCFVAKRLHQMGMRNGAPTEAVGMDKASCRQVVAQKERCQQALDSICANSFHFICKDIK